MSVTISTTSFRGKEYGVLNGRLGPNVFEAMRAMPARGRWREGKYYFPLTRQNINFVKEVLPDAPWLNIEPLNKVTDYEQKEDSIIKQKSNDLLIHTEHFPFKTTPFDHQKKAFYISRDERNFGLFMEMGTGKTKVAIDTAAYLYERGEIDTLLITAPNGVHGQWINEQIPTHLPDWVPRECIAYKSNSGRTKAYQNQFARVMETTDKLRIISMHVDAFSHKGGVLDAEMILKRGRCLWVMDESTRIKKTSAQRTKNIIALSRLAKYKRIMSGAPITQGIEDLFTQFQFLDEDILGFSSFYTFRNYFCDTRPIPGAPAGAVVVIGYKNQDQLKRLVDGHTFRVTKDECLDLPDKIYTTRHVELSPEQMRLYEKMKEDLLVVLEDNTVIEAPLAITQLMKLQQILCGFIIDEEGKVKLLSNARAELTAELISDTQGKVIVWSRFKAEVGMIAKELERTGIQYVEYHGGIGQEARKYNLKAFQEDPAVKVFLANPQAGGTGLNLACASTAIYASNDFNADTRWQSEDRIHRIGQKYNATYIDLIVPNTIDTKILGALRRKKNVADSLLDVRDLLS